jgi:hypothetical protein
VAEARVDLDVVVAPHRVDRPVAAGDRVQHRLGLAHAELVAPVRAFAVRARRLVEPQLTADVRRQSGVGEVPDEPPERLRRPRRVRVGERDDLAVRLAHRAVLRRDLSAALDAEEAHALIAFRDAGDDVVGRIGRGVGGDDDLDRSSG